MTDRPENLRYVDMTGDILTIKPLQTSPSWGRETVVSVQIADGSDVDATPAIAYVRVGDVDQVIEALRKARDEAAQAPDRVVAYRNTDRPGVLLCREHGDGWMGLTPVTSEDLPDGGLCTWHDCGRDVLAAT